MRSLAEGQSRLLAIVENLSGDTDRQFSSSSQAKAEAGARRLIERVSYNSDKPAFPAPGLAGFGSLGVVRALKRSRTSFSWGG